MSSETQSNDLFRVGQFVQTLVFIGAKSQPMAKGKVVAVHSGFCEVDIMSLHGGAPWVVYHPNNALLRLDEKGNETQ